MKFSAILSVIFICLLFCEKSFAQNEFDVESPSEADISLYAKPEKGEALALIPHGETLKSLETLKKGDITWHKVKYGEDIGYVNAKFLTESLGKRKAVAAYQQANITKLVLVYATSQYEGFCYLITLDNTQKVKIKNRFKCKFGVAGIAKQKEGDKKTPLGHYCVVSESPISGEEDIETYNKFGGYNIHLNYPNKHDVDAKKTGGGICIHGGYTRNTEGCVRIVDEGQEISTKNILTVGNFVTKGTHVMITNEIPALFKQKSNTELDVSAYSFIQNACGKICSHTEWKTQVAAFSTNLAAATDLQNSNRASLSPISTTPPPAATTPTNTTTPTDMTGYVTGYIKSSTGYANLREKPSKEARSLEKIPVNQPISYKEGGTWWEVISQQGNKGYVHSSLIAK